MKREWHRRRLLAVQRADNVRNLAGAEHHVDLRDLGLELVSVPLAQAAGHDQPFARPAALEFGHLEDRVDRFLLGRINEGAGIDDDDVRVLGVGGDFMPGLARQAQHDFAIHKILRTAERQEPEFQESTTMMA